MSRPRGARLHLEGAPPIIFLPRSPSVHPRAVIAMTPNRLRPSLLLVLLMLASLAPVLRAQVPTAEAQIAAAVLPAPPELQAGASVLGYDAGGTLVTLREGSNDLICLTDTPGDDRFHVACYHASLEPFMARGRQLRGEGHESAEIQRIRGEEIAAGSLPMPDGPALLYQLFGAPDGFDAATGTATGLRRLTVVYMPGATVETTGLPTSAPAGQPWLMDPGKPWAHIMLLEPEQLAETGEEAETDEQ